MTPESVLTVGSQALRVAILISIPLLLTILAVGLLVSIFQAATQINEMTLSFIPKLLALVLVLLVAGGWILGVLMDFTLRLFRDIPFLIG